MSATQQEIARQLGVSQATVSMVLNGGGKISPRTRRQILECAASLGYRHNSSAQALRRGRFGCISLLLSTTKRYSFLPIDLLRGIQGKVREYDTQITIHEVPDASLSDEQFVHEMLRRWSSDGLLIDYTHNLPARMIDLIRSYQVPSVWLNAKLESDCVYPDDYSAMRQATQRLLDLGHRRIAYIDLTRNSHYSVRDRYDGYVEAMFAADCLPCVLTLAVVRSERLKVIRKWLREPNRPTAVVTYEDREAIPLFAAAMEMGLRVPEDLSIIAVHHRPVDAVGIAVATMQIDFAQVGDKAVQMLVQKIEKPDAPLPPQKVPSIWHPGETLAPPG